MSDPVALAAAFVAGAALVAALWLRSARGWRRDVLAQLAALRAEIKALKGGGSK